MSTIYAWPYLKRPVNYRPYFFTACERPVVAVQAQIRIKLPRVLQLQSSSLRVTDAATQASTGLHMLHDIDLREIFECAHLKFTVSGRSKQATKQANKHTHTCVQCGHTSVGLTQAQQQNIM